MEKINLIRKLKRILVLVLALITAHSINGQEVTILENGKVIKALFYDRSESCDEDLVFTVAESMPYYIGGIEQLERDLNKNIDIPKQMKEVFYLKFTVNCNDKSFGFNRYDGKESDLSKSIMENMNQLQHWKSGQHRTDKIDCFMTLRIKITNKKIKISS